MQMDACRLCLVVESALNCPTLKCFGPITTTRLSSNSSVNYNVAEVLIKHFWFELHQERDADAYVCLPCWTKVAEFHHFYESVLLLYQPKREHGDVDTTTAASRVAAKLEVMFEGDDDATQPDGNDDGPSSEDDDGNDGAGGGDCEWFDESFPKVSIKQEEDVMIESAASSDSPSPQPRRERNRRLKTKTSARIDESKSAKQTKHSHKDESSGTNRPEIATYFTLKCDLCDEPLANLTIARNHHQSVHKQLGYLSCGCGRRFTRIDAIRDHCAFHADPSPYKCNECDKVYKNVGRLAVHQKSKHPEATGTLKAEAEPTAEEPSHPSSSASAADMKSPPSTSLVQIRREEDELIRRYMSMACSLCDKGGKKPFDSFKRLRQHQRQVHGQKSYLECCGKKFVLKCRAVEHCQWHENPQQFDCKICGRSLTRSSTLRDHYIRFHQSSAPFIYQCDQCDTKFQMADQLRSHKRRVHMAEDDHKFECFSCHRRFVLQWQLRYHLRGANTKRPTFMCDVCAKHFTQKHAYEQHYAVEHGNALKCQCPECGKWLKHASRLPAHMLRHRSVPSKCEECGHVAPNARALYMHRRRVHSAPTLKCLVCGRMFKRPKPLREHMAMHAGITDLYTCAYCPQTFRSESNMYKHRRQVHGAEFEADRLAASLAEDLRNTQAAAGIVVAASERRV